MYKVAGAPFGCSYAQALDTTDSTIKTWRRRGEVSLKFLQGFAERHGVPLDMLRLGKDAYEAAQAAQQLTAEEELLLARYRVNPPVLREAAMRVLGGGAGTPATEIKKQVTVTANGGQAAGRDINNG